MKPLLLSAVLVAAATPLHAQEEFRDFVQTAAQMAGGRDVQRETAHFKISAPAAGAELLSSHLEILWDFLKETLGVEPATKINLTFFHIREETDALERGLFERYDAAADVLYFKFDYDWKRDIARGVAGAFLQKLAPERAAQISPALLFGLKAYLGNFDGRMEPSLFHTPVKGHLHVAKRAQSMASRGKLMAGQKLADLKTAEIGDYEPAAWALAGYLLNAKGKRDRKSTRLNS